MADLKYPCSSSPPAATFTLESDDISTLLNSLLQNSSLPSTSPFSAPPPAPPGSADLRSQFAGSAALSDSAAAAIGCFGFPFRGGGGGGSYAPAADDSDRSGTVLPAAIPSSSAERFGDLDFDSERDQDAYDVLRESALATGARSSSKRSRAAEVHNLSEKRRRQKINEKLKALQKLIPNSNKTDKASMLDEAIEYLKQLQLQVQMLAMRNGSTLHPFYAAGGMHRVQVGTSYNDGDGVPTCTSQGIGTMLANGEMPFNNIYMPSNECDSSDQKIFMHKPIAGTSNSERSLLGIEPSTTAHCRPYMTNMPSNELCGGDMKPPQLQLDMARCGTESSSGISS